MIYDTGKFKQRMQSLRSYRELNPDKGYWEWRNSLPPNLRDTDDAEYDMRGAYESGALPRLENDGYYHLPSRDPRTGRIFKLSWHPTYGEALKVDADLGYRAYLIGDKTYTWNDEDGLFIPWQLDNIPSYADGGEDDNLNPLDYRGPTYGLLLLEMRLNDPATYDAIAALRAMTQSPSSEMVTYINAAGEPTTVPNALRGSMESALSPEDLPGIGDVLAAEQVRQDFQEGNYSSAAIGAGFLGLGLLSDAVAPYVRPFIRRARNFITAPERIDRALKRAGQLRLEYDIARIGEGFLVNQANRDFNRLTVKQKTALLRNLGLTDLENDRRVLYMPNQRRRAAEDFRDRYDYMRFAQENNLNALGDRNTLDRDTRTRWRQQRASNGNTVAQAPDYNSSVYLDLERTTPNDLRELLRQLYADDPQYIRFAQENNLPFWEQSTVDQWIDKQRTAIRGVYSDVDNADISILDPMFTLTKTRNDGGDRLRTAGGLYTSNSSDIADRFSRSLGNSGGTAAYAILQAPDIDRTVPIRELLTLIRRRIIPYDVETARGLTNKELVDLGYIGKQAQYSTGRGRLLPAYETSFFAESPGTKVANVIDYRTSADTRNMNGRWGAGAGGANITDRLYSPRTLGYSYGDFLNLYRLAYNNRLSRISDRSFLDILDSDLQKAVNIEMIGHDAYKLGSLYRDLTTNAERRARSLSDKYSDVRDKRSNLRFWGKTAGIGLPIVGGISYAAYDLLHDDTDDDTENTEAQPMTIYLPPVPSYDEGGEVIDGGILPEVTVTAKDPYPNAYDFPAPVYDQRYYDERRKKGVRDTANEHLRRLIGGLSKTVGTAAGYASLFGGGGWALTRLLSGNRATRLGRALAPTVLPSNAIDTAGDIVDLINDPSLSGAAEVAASAALGRWRDFGSTARLAAELGSLALNAYNLLDTDDDAPSYKDGGIHIKKANRGKFTESAKRAGLTVQLHARSVLNNPHASKLLKKRALFAVNMKKIANKRKRSK